MENSRSVTSLQKPLKGNLAINRANSQFKFKKSTIFSDKEMTKKQQLASFNKGKQYYFKRIRPMQQAQLRYDRL